MGVAWGMCNLLHGSVDVAVLTENIYASQSRREKERQIRVCMVR
jgi:hypothetical protein